MCSRKEAFLRDDEPVETKMKMIYVPETVQELEDIHARFEGVLDDISMRHIKRTMHMNQDLQWCDCHSTLRRNLNSNQMTAGTMQMRLCINLHQMNLRIQSFGQW
eukprot:517144_1